MTGEGSNCDSIIAQIHDAVVQIKPLIPFAHKPFWRMAQQKARMLMAVCASRPNQLRRFVCKHFIMAKRMD